LARTSARGARAVAAALTVLLVPGAMLVFLVLCALARQNVSGRLARALQVLTEDLAMLKAVCTGRRQRARPAASQL
jgi:hypothetical protein